MNDGDGRSERYAADLRERIMRSREGLYTRGLEDALKLSHEYFPELGEYTPESGQVSFILKVTGPGSLEEYVSSAIKTGMSRTGKTARALASELGGTMDLTEGATKGLISNLINMRGNRLPTHDIESPGSRKKLDRFARVLWGVDVPEDDEAVVRAKKLYKRHFVYPPEDLSE